MLVEYWLWQYKDPVGGHTCKTSTKMTAGEAASYFRAQRIPGTLEFREIEVEFEKPFRRRTSGKRTKRPVP